MLGRMGTVDAFHLSANRLLVRNLDLRLCRGDRSGSGWGGALGAAGDWGAEIRFERCGWSKPGTASAAAPGGAAEDGRETARIGAAPCRFGTTRPNHQGPDRTCAL